MKVVEETHTRLVIKHEPIVNWVLGSALFTIALFFWTPYICDFSYLRLICNRSSLPEINCELKKFPFLGSMEKTKIFAPKKAYIQTKTSSKGSKSYQVIIVSKFGEFSLLPDISYQEDEVFISKLNDFINSRESFLTLQQNSRADIFFVSLYFSIIVVFGLFLVTTPATNCTFSKSINKVLIKRKSLRSNKVIEYPLEEIVSLRIQDKPYRNSTIHRAVISTKDAKDIPINPQYTDKRSVENVVARIRKFLNFQY